MEYKCNDIVYTYQVVCNKLKNRYESLDFIRYGENHSILESFAVSPTNNNISGQYNYYTWHYYNEKDDITTSNSCIVDISPFTKPLSYFYNIIYHRTPNKIINNHLILDAGFSISEEIPYGFIYTRKDGSNTANSADKYGLKNTNEIDYSKFISKYYVTDNEVLIIDNNFMEYYTYIATKKEHGIVMTQNDITSPANSNYCIIYLRRYPMSINIGNNKETKYGIDTKYNELGITTSMIINGEEKCQYEQDEISTTSIHPLVYEPFCEELYKDILLNDLPYDVMEEYESTEEYIEYKRTVFKK